ncbi:four helix bundle protein [Sediminibacterium goheungense]|uniref:Four helix bundle protein n=1 Tax=Sediminibacterium goheungense TaxID=1086393 RepID=A0A4R6J399_9BACT|nr:four helix bundle protein [Sediminibacterium goheungense]TDO28756.1 four helix bundle protein [Sediminibacterium goheungense]
MFLQLAHTRLIVFARSRDLILESYSLTRYFPESENFGLTQQIRRAACSIHLNLAEGCSRKSTAERNRFFEIARGSLIEVDTAVGIAIALKYIPDEQLENIKVLIIENFKLLSAMIH